MYSCHSLKGALVAQRVHPGVVLFDIVIQLFRLLQSLLCLLRWGTPSFQLFIHLQYAYVLVHQLGMVPLQNCVLLIQIFVLLVQVFELLIEGHVLPFKDLELLLQMCKRPKIFLPLSILFEELSNRFAETV